MGDETPRLPTRQLTEVGKQIAQEAVTAFLQNLAGGRQVSICGNDQCRVRIYVIDAGMGTKVPACPACYGDADTVGAGVTGT